MSENRQMSDTSRSFYGNYGTSQRRFEGENSFYEANNMTIQENSSNSVQTWLNGILFKRKVIGSIGIAMFASFAILVQTMVTTFNIFHPIESLYEIFSNLLTFSFYATLTIQSVIVFGLVFVLSNLIMNVAAEEVLEWKNATNWAFLGALSFGECLNLFLIFINARHHDSNNSEGEDVASAKFAFLFISLVLVSFDFYFNTNFQYTLPQSTFKIQNMLLALLTPSADSVYLFRIKNVFSCIKNATIIWLGYQLIYDIYGIRFIITTSILIHVFLTVYRINLTYTLATEVLNLIVMQPYPFELPSKYNVAEPGAKEFKHLMNVFDFGDTTHKLFALYDLRLIAMSDFNRRQEIFALSVPGNFPRNWISAKNICIGIIDSLNDIFVQVNEVIKSIKMHDAALIYCDRSPSSGRTREERLRRTLHPALREKDDKNERFENVAKDEASKEKLQQKLKPNQLSKYDKLVKKILCLWYPPKRTITFLNQTLAVYSIETIANFMVCSYEEDAYGSVQGDVEHIIRRLLVLSNSIDSYSKGKHMLDSQWRIDDELMIKNINTALKECFDLISRQFGEIFKDGQFNDDEQAALRRLL